MGEIERIEIHDRDTTQDPYDENVAVWVEHDPDTQKYRVKYVGIQECDEEDCDTEREAIEKMIEWAENIEDNLEWLDDEERTATRREIARIRMKYGILGGIKHYTHSTPEGTAIWEYGNGDIVIYEDRREPYTQYHIYYEDGMGGETYEGFTEFERAWEWATAIAENTIGYDEKKEKWTERAKEIRKYEGW